MSKRTEPTTKLPKCEVCGNQPIAAGVEYGKRMAEELSAKEWAERCCTACGMPFDELDAEGG
jgi:hypothetical protein